MYVNTIKVGTVVQPISRNRGIAVFRTEDGGRFIKVKNEEDDWRAITLLNYRGAGLVVFLNDINELEHTQKIGTGEILRTAFRVKILSVYEKHAVGAIVGEDGCSVGRGGNDRVRREGASEILTYDPGGEDDLDREGDLGRSGGGGGGGFENLFNALCDKVDADYDELAPLRNTHFKGATFSPDECATILKIQDALYRILDGENTIDRVGESDFAASNS